ncbi:hypothetical protein LX16_2382 [Stackebrandtia albiflava]|uniref:Uncharacterized protein n=1 Tax=Stackebrandtia albiflava TaxID=406432 RepID=A0A562V1D1_9ACTN|nr:hypothetical protein [Stackebrandtia albiflava]TWJ11655.1 hypothetical protein LX16_2382 [Stackebrandtia albiflava]
MSTDTLTERYVREVVKRLPADQRDDVADELRATIADTVDAHGGDPAAAEHAVLTDMGDPIRLAARYADRPVALIGPVFYPAYIRLLKLLLSMVLPVVTVLMMTLEFFDGGDIGQVIGAGVGAALSVGAQMIAWLTVVFALVDRAGGRDAYKPTEWTPDDLPELRATDDNRTTVIAAAVWNLVLAGLIVWQHTAPTRLGGLRVEVMHPDLWSGMVWPMLAGLVGMAIVEVLRIAARRWTYGLATAYSAAGLVFALPLAWVLYRREFFNPEFLALFNEEFTVMDEFYTVAAIGVLAVVVAEILRRFMAAHRS